MPATVVGQLWTFYGITPLQSWVCNFLPPGGVFVPQLPTDGDYEGDAEEQIEETEAWFESLVDLPLFELWELYNYLAEPPAKLRLPLLEPLTGYFFRTWAYEDEGEGLLPLGAYLFELLWSFGFRF